MLFPLGCKDKRVEERAVIEGFGKDLPISFRQMTIRKKVQSQVILGNSYTLWTWRIDWMYKEFGVLAYVYELNSSQLGFQPSYTPWRDRTVTKFALVG